LQVANRKPGPASEVYRMRSRARVRALLLSAFVALGLPIRPVPALAARHTPPHLALWMEPGGNLVTLSTAEGVRQALDQARAMGVDVVIPEAKNAWGYTTYPSAFAPTIDTSPMPHGAPPTYPPPTQWYPHDYDMLGTIIQEAHARGIRVDVAVNSFSEGFSPMRIGPAFQRPGWLATTYVATRPIIAPDGTSYAVTGEDVPRGENQLIMYSPDAGPATPASRWGVEVAVSKGTVTEVRDRASAAVDPGPTPIPRGGYVLSGHGAAARWLAHALPLGAAVTVGPVESHFAQSVDESIYAFVNPADPEVRSYELAVVYEVLTRYDVDGIILDRTRYEDVTADFSPLSRAQFEAFIGRPVNHWPDDVYRYAAKENWITRVPGPLYRRWLGYRAHTIMTYARTVGNLVHTVKPHVALGMYVGSWYPVYFNEGVNWASPNVRPDYPWVGSEWVDAGLAPLLDYLMIGLYYRPVTMWEAFANHYHAEISIQGGTSLGRSLVDGATSLVGGLLVSLYDDDPRHLTRAIRMVDGLAQGTMLFDLVYLNPDLERAVPQP